MTAPRYKRRSRSDAVGAAKKYDSATWREWVAHYRKGKSMREIAALYGVAPSTVMRRLHGLNVPGRTPEQRRRLSTAHAVKIAGTGLTQQQAAEVSGVSQPTVNRRLREAEGLGPFPSEVDRKR